MRECRKSGSRGGQARGNRPATLAIFVIGLAVLLGGTAASGTHEQRKIENKVLRDTANGRQTSFVILLKDQADLSKAYGMKDQDARGWYVYRTLKAKPADTGAAPRMLAARGVSYRSFWVANVIIAGGDRTLVDDLAARSDVQAIESNAKSNWLQGEERRKGVAPARPTRSSPG